MTEKLAAVQLTRRWWGGLSLALLGLCLMSLSDWFDGDARRPFLLIGSLLIVLGAVIIWSALFISARRAGSFRGGLIEFGRASKEAPAVPWIVTAFVLFVVSIVLSFASPS